MKLNNLGGCSSIHEYVTGKLRRLEKETPDFAVLFRYMFSEKTNVFYEKYAEFRIVKTTYAEAAEEVLRRTAVLKKLLPEASEGSVVGLSMGNSLEWLLNFWAILASGHCPLFMNLRLDKATLEEALKALGASAVVSDGERYAVPTVTEEEIREELKAEGYGKPADASEPAAPGTEGTFGDTFFVMSSGTSSHVKLCVYTAKEVFSLLKDSEEIVAKSPSMQRHYMGELKQLTFLPFYHIFGFVAVYLWFGFFARTFVELRDYAPETILSTIRRHRVTHVFAVPLFWEKVYSAALQTIRGRGDRTWDKFKKGISIGGKLEKLPALGKAFSKKAFAEVRKNLFGESVCFLISGGGAIRSDVLKFFNRIGYHMANGYGMSEIGIASVELSEKAAVRELGSVGKPLSSYAYRIEDGVLYVKSGSAAAYVLSDGVKTERPEWFRTEDLAEVQNGSYFIAGRSDDLIVDASGENLNPNALEPKLIVSGIRNLALVPAEENGQILPTLVAEISPFLSEGRFLEIDRELKARLSDNRLSGAVRKIVYVTEPLIAESEFKLNRKRIASDLAAGRLPERKAAPREKTGNASDQTDGLSDAILSLYAEALEKPADTVGYETDFFTEEGGSSLDYLLLLSKIREKFGVTIKGGEGETLHTRKEMEEAIRKRIDDVDSVL